MLRLEHEGLPRAQGIMDKVDRGDRLGDWDIMFLEEMCIDVHSIKPLLDRHHEYYSLVVSAIHLYKIITDKALENETRTT